MKILVTGGAGFIGSEFVRLMVRCEVEIVVVDKLTYAGDLARLESVKGKYKFYEVDICDRASVEEIFEKEKPAAVVHWAAESHVDRSILDASPFLTTNVIGTQVLLDAARKFGVEKFVNVATDEVYGELGEDGSFFEDSQLAPNSPYAVSKTSADMLGRAFHRTYGLPVVTVRPSNNYGPWQYPEKLLPVIFLKALANEPIPVYGKGENVREWLHVSDCARAVAAVLDKAEPGEIYNIGSGNERKNIDVVKKVLEIMGKPESLIEFVKDRPGHDFRYSLNFDKIRNELRWSPQIDFETGLPDTIGKFREQKDWMHAKLEYLREYWKSVYRKA